MARNGKIARLPREVREALNNRLEDGEMGPTLLAWLNALPATQALLAREFGGRPVNAQNLSDWRLGGFVEWRRHQDSRAWVGSLVEHADDLAAETGDVPLGDRLAGPVAVALGRQLGELQAAETLGPEQRRELLAVARELAQLRRGDHTAARVRLEQEAWAAEQTKAREKKAQLAHWQATSPVAFTEMPFELQVCLAASRRLAGAASPEPLPSNSE